MDKKLIEERNEEIKKAILVSQMQDSDGFAVFKEFLNNKIKEFRFQDILGLKDEKTINTQQGIVMGLEEVSEYLRVQKLLAEKPMTDPDTGEKEILNSKKYE